MAHAATIDPRARIASPAYPRPIAAWLGLLLLGAITIAAALNNAIVYLVVEPLKQSLGLSDTQVGALNGIALTLVTAIAVVPMGWLADRVNRLVLLASCVAIWSLATIGFAMAQSFETLFGFAMGTAIGEAVLGPMVYSIIPDMFPREKWIQANLVYFVLGRLGGFAGLALAGWLVAFAGSSAASLPAVIADLDPWRIALILSTVISPVLVVLTFFMPVRRASVPIVEEGAGVAPLISYFRENARALAGVFLGFGIIYGVYGGTAVWFPTALARSFGVDTPTIGVVLGTTGAISAALGIAVAFILARQLRPRFGDVTPMLLAQIAACLIAIAAPFMLIAPSFTAAYLIYSVQIFALTVCLSLSPAVLQVLAPSFLRGRVIALGGMISILIMSAAPMVIGMMSDHLFGGSEGLMRAIVTATVASAAVGFVMLRFGGSRLPSTIDLARAADERAECQEPLA